MHTTASAHTASYIDRVPSLNLVPEQFRPTIATIMFTDVEDLTGLASALGLVETTHFLIEHVALTQQVVLKHGGIVQNFTGDGVLALWLGTQMHPRDTALRALAAVADLAPEISISNARRRSHGLLTRRIRVGLHTGEVMFVNDCQRDFSFVVGSEVNFARRVEQAGKKEDREGVDTLVMVSGATLHLADCSAGLTDPHGLVRLTTVELSALRCKQKRCAGIDDGIAGSDLRLGLPAYRVEEPPASVVRPGGLNAEPAQ